jgi:exodeoxyribonuclease VIII
VVSEVQARKLSKINGLPGTGVKREELMVRYESPDEPEDLENADYHRHSAVSKSHLDQVARSPLHYWARYLDPNRVEPEPTPAMLVGSAVHTHVLELDQWDARYVTAPEGIDRRTKQGKAEWEAFSTAATGRTVISRTDAEQVMRMGHAVFAHPAAAMLLKQLPGKAETTWMWTDEATGLQCKCRPDWLTDDHSLIIDLKTTEDASVAGFRKSIANWRYHVQAAWYLDGIEKATGTRPDQFIFVVVEKRAPYACAVYAADAEMIAAGAAAAARDLEVLATCKAANAWPGYSDQIETISLPPWMRPRPDGSMPQQPPTEIETY